MSADSDIETARLTRVIGSLPGGIPQTAVALLRTGGDAADLAAACLFSEDRAVARLVELKLEASPHDVTLNAAATLVRAALTIESPEMKGAIYGDDYLRNISKSGVPLSETHPYLMHRTAEGRDDLTTLVSASALAQRLPESARQAWNAVITRRQSVMYPAAQSFLHDPFELARMNNEVRGGDGPVLSTERFLKSLEAPASGNRPPDVYAVPPALPLMGSLAAYTSAQYVHVMPDCVTGNDSVMAITRGMHADGLNIQAENPLCIVPHLLDGSLHMPPAARFFSTGDYNAALLHEVAHAAGEENRDDRAQRVHYGLTGDISRQEEIIADLTVLSLSHRYANTRVNPYQLLCHAQEQADELRESDPRLADAHEISALNSLAERGAQYIHDAVTRHLASVPAPASATRLADYDRKFLEENCSTKFILSAPDNPADSVPTSASATILPKSMNTHLKGAIKMEQQEIESRLKEAYSGARSGKTDQYAFKLWEPIPGESLRTAARIMDLKTGEEITMPMTERLTDMAANTPGFGTDGWLSPSQTARPGGSVTTAQDYDSLFQEVFTRDLAQRPNVADAPASTVNAESPALRIRDGLLETHKAITRLEGHITVSKMAPARRPEPSNLDHRQQRLLDALHDRIGVTSEHIERAKNLIGEMPSPDAQVRELRALHDRLTTVHNNLGDVPDYLSPKLLQGVVAQQLSGVDAHLIASTQARMENEKSGPPAPGIHHSHPLKKGPNT